VTTTLPAPILAALAAVIGVIAMGSVRIDGGAARIRTLEIWPIRERTTARWQSPSAARWLGGALGLLVALIAPFPGVVLAPILCLAGWRLPVFLERRAARRRRAAVNAQVPQLLDLLAAGSSAGLSGQVAFRRAVDALGGPLAMELHGALDAVDLGARWRDELAAASARLDLPDLRRTINALSRTDSLGASLSGSTAELAASVRSARRAAVTERARTAPVKMLFPLVFLVLPAFLLLTVVPVLLTTLRSIH
jgi:tight adherence protein C